MRYKLLVAYNGTNYSGWQIQETPTPPPTIQGELEKALQQITGDKIRVIGSGRTDAGVHAHGQVAHFVTASPKMNMLPDLRQTLNALLPADIRILDAHLTHDQFHAQHDAVSKTYIYQLWTEKSFIPPVLQNFAWHCGPLDEKILQNGSKLFQGAKDFASFQNAGSDCLSTSRNVSSILIKTLDPLPFYLTQYPFIQIAITANGFLKQMVRNIIGFLVAAAQHKIELSSFADIIAARDRSKLPTRTAPACGLFLARVDYKPQKAI